MINKIHIYDLDGTVIDSSHRYRTIINAKGETAIDYPYWIANRSKALADKLLPLAKQYRKELKSHDTFVIVATARVMSENEISHVKNILGWPHYMISRAAHDNRSGADLKIAGLNKILNLRQFATIKNRVYFEDNIQYLRKVSAVHNLHPIYIPSNQGH